MRRFVPLAAAALASVVLAGQVLAQAPDVNPHASDTAKAKVAEHRRSPGIPASQASDTAKAKVAAHRATQVRGSAVMPGQRPATAATPAVPSTGAKPATPASGGNPAIPATPAAPATPAVPHSPGTHPTPPTSPGQSGSHRP